MNNRTDLVKLFTELGYRCGGEFKQPSKFTPKVRVESWVGPGPVILVQFFGDAGEMGWDVFAPITDDGKIEATFEALRARVGSYRAGGST
jgi:hypothetical protein